MDPEDLNDPASGDKEITEKPIRGNALGDAEEENNTPDKTQEEFNPPSKAKGGKGLQKIPSSQKAKIKKKALKKTKQLAQKATKAAAKKTLKEGGKELVKGTAAAATAEAGGAGELAVEATEKGFSLGRKIFKLIRRPEQAVNLPTEILEEVKKEGKRLLWVIVFIVGIILMLFFMLTGSVSQGEFENYDTTTIPAVEQPSETNQPVQIFINGPQKATANDFLTYDIVATKLDSATKNIELTYTIPENSTFVSATGIPTCSNDIEGLANKCRNESKSVIWTTDKSGEKFSVTIRINPDIKDVFIINIVSGRGF